MLSKLVDSKSVILNANKVHLNKFIDLIVVTVNCINIRLGTKYHHLAIEHPVYRMFIDGGIVINLVNRSSHIY